MKNTRLVKERGGLYADLCVRVTSLSSHARARLEVKDGEQTGKREEHHVRIRASVTGGRVGGRGGKEKKKEG